MNEERLKNALKEPPIKFADYTEEELSKMELSSLSKEGVQEAVRRKLIGKMNSNGLRQKVAPADSIKQFKGE